MVQLTGFQEYLSGYLKVLLAISGGREQPEFVEEVIGDAAHVLQRGGCQLAGLG